MPKNLIFTAKEAKVLKELVKHGVEFMIVGLSAANLQGAAVVTQDVDLWFKDLTDPNLKKALRKAGATYVPPVTSNPPMLVGTDVNFFDIVLTMDGLQDFDAELKNCVEIPLGSYKVKVLGLERIIASKKASNREKDEHTLPLLEDTLRVLKETKST